MGTYKARPEGRGNRTNVARDEIDHQIASHFEEVSTEASVVSAPVMQAPAFRVDTIAKDRYWPKPKDPLADWDKASGQAGLPQAEREGVAALLARKGGAFNVEGDLRAEAGDFECGRRRHISGKHVQTSQAIVDLQDAGFAPGQAKHMVDPKRGSRSRGFTYEA